MTQPDPVMSEAEHAALGQYLTPVGSASDGSVSSFWAGLRDARGATGRDLGTGAVVDPQMSASWLGAIGYLCFLDQVGTAVYRTDRDRRLAGERSVERALRLFADTALPEDRAAVYGLRCALAHDFSLVNEGQKGRYRYFFGLTAEGGGTALVQPALVDWIEGVPVSDLDGIHATWIDLRILGDTAEVVHQQVLACFAAGVLRCALADPSEMRRRYSFWVREPTMPSVR